jgi:hypothetical protein
MEERPDCVDAEDIVKCVLSPHIVDGEVSHSLFRGKGSSYSRLKIYPLKKILRVFWRDLHNPPKDLMTGYMVLNVGRIRAIGAAHKSKDKKDGIAIRVIPVPLLKYFRRNKAHAETHPKISDSLAKKIKDYAKVSFVKLEARDKPNWLAQLLSWLI